MKIKITLFPISIFGGVIMNKLKCTSLPGALDSEDKICLSLYNAKKFSLANGSEVNLKCGLRQITVKIQVLPINEQNNSYIYLSSDVYEKILLPKSMDYDVIFKNGTFIIGPVIAVLLGKKLLQRYAKGLKVRESLDFYSEAGQKAGVLVYFFNLDDIDLTNKSVNGLIRIRDKKGFSYIKKQPLPVPDAIHNRLAVAKGSINDKKLNELENSVPDIKIINRITKINKWKIYKILSRDKSASVYLPKTLKFQSPKNITDMLKEFPFVILKPVGRSLGLGVIKIIKLSSDNFKAYYNLNGKNLSIQGNMDFILDNLKKVMGKRLYIVQQGISLTTFEDCPFDLRVTMQKDSSSNWTLSRWYARVAAKHSIVTNLAAGGRGVKITKALYSSLGSKTEMTLNKIYKASLVICKALDEKIKDIGDLGLDIGIDEDGNPYLIEVNFRDFKKYNDELGQQEGWEKMYYKPIYFLKHLYEEKIARDTKD